MIRINLDVMMLVDGDKVTNGNPLVKNAEVVAEVLEHGKEDKIVVFKYKLNISTNTFVIK